MVRHALVALLFAACGRTGFDALAVGDDVGPGGDGGSSSADDGGSPADGVILGDGSMAYVASFTTYSASSPPAVRRSSGAALQPGTSEQVWTYGGYNGAYLSDVDAFTPATSAWTTPTPAGTGPGARERHAVAWDPSGNALVVFGGQNRPLIMFQHYDTLFTLRSGAWSQVPKAGNWPGARKDAALVWIPHLSKFLLYGGDDGAMAQNRYADVWLLTLDSAANTASWQELAPTGTAPAQSAACVAYDPATHRLYVFGGETADGVNASEMHLYDVDANAWQLVTTTGTLPTGLSFAQCAWDPGVNAILYYGGQDATGNPVAGPYVFEPASSAWFAIPPADQTPGARSDAGAVYSATAGGMIFYGGRTGASTYTSETVLMALTLQ